MKRVVAALIVTGSLLLSAQAVQSPLLHSARQVATDLEIGDGRFVSYADLLRMPQVSYTSSESNFPKPVRVGGVALEQLKHLFGSNEDMVVAICKDGYRSNYPATYLAAHHPVLVLTLDGKAQKDWPASPEAADLSPYVISNPNFKPSFKVLAHTDEAQIPFQVVQLVFRSESQVFGAIKPHGNFPPGSLEMQGYQISQQNCYRCHNMGAEGGQMASVPWPVVGAVAKSRPEFFAQYVRNPQALNPRSRMAGSPGYDDQTIAALRAYFSTFAAGGQ